MTATKSSADELQIESLGQVVDSSRKPIIIPLVMGIAFLITGLVVGVAGIRQAMGPIGGRGLLQVVFPEFVSILFASVG